MTASVLPLQSVLADPITRFVAHKRALGRSYDTELGALRLLDRFLAERNVLHLEHVTADLIEAFMTTRPRSRPRSYNHLLGTVRRLFEWLVQHQELEQSPVRIGPRRVTAHRRPFIFDLPAASRLLALARELPDNPRALMRGATYHALFAILYGLGLRVGEACRLQHGDLDLGRQLLVIRESKFYKSRLVPFGPRMAAVLGAYAEATARRIANPGAASPLFSFTARGSVHPCTVSQTFHSLVPRLDLSVPSGCSPPRLHDLRHSFAVGTLLRWYRTGVDPGAALLQLATFMGHVDVSSTATYLQMTDSLLLEANRRFESFVQPVLAEGVSS
jgi:site-specific recombinase XerD